MTLPVHGNWMLGTNNKRAARHGRGRPEVVLPESVYAAFARGDEEPWRLAARWEISESTLRRKMAERGIASGWRLRKAVQIASNRRYAVEAIESERELRWDIDHFIAAIAGRTAEDAARGYSAFDS